MYLACVLLLEKPTRHMLGLTGKSNATSCLSETLLKVKSSLRSIVLLYSESILSWLRIISGFFISISVSPGSKTFLGLNIVTGLSLVMKYFLPLCALWQTNFQFWNSLKTHLAKSMLDFNCPLYPISGDISARNIDPSVVRSTSLDKSAIASLMKMLLPIMKHTNSMKSLERFKVSGFGDAINSLSTFAYFFSSLLCSSSCSFVL